VRKPQPSKLHSVPMRKAPLGPGRS
jgi:hypothetical protein